MRWVACVVAGALLLLVGPTAKVRARDPGAAPETTRWLVLPVRRSGADGSASASVDRVHAGAESVRRELSVRGHEVWRANRASERFEVVVSAPAPAVSQSEIDRWVERSRAAVRYLARADYEAARRELEAAQRFASRAAEELNREAARAQRVLDTCLFMVRAYVETKNDAEARRQARECRQRVPRVEPTAFRHTPEVRALLAEVDAEMAAEAPGTIAVSSSPAHCLVRMNGVEFGRTPLSGIELPVGTYRVQVECEEGQRGRIHRVAVVSGANVLSFDAELDRAVRTQPVLHLSYASVEAWEARMAHVAAVAAALDGASAVSVSDVGAGVLRLDLRAEGYAPASSWVFAGEGSSDREAVRRAIDAMFEGRSVDFTGAHPIARSSWSAEAPAGAEVGPARAAVVESGKEPTGGVPRPRDQRIAGWALFGAGVASIGASIGLHVSRGELGDRFLQMPADLNAAQRWRDARIAVWTTAAFGGAAASAAMPLLLPNYERTPWWAWMSGALGLGLTGYAIYEGVTMTSCPEPFVADDAAARACVARGQEAGRLSLALAGAAPLLTVPLVYSFRPLRAEPSVSVRGHGAVVHVRRAF